MPQCLHFYCRHYYAQLTACVSKQHSLYYDDLDQQLLLINGAYPYLTHHPLFYVCVPRNNAIRNLKTAGGCCMFVGCVVGLIMMIKIDSGGEVGLFFQIFKHRSDINTLHLDDKFLVWRLYHLATSN